MSVARRIAMNMASAVLGKAVIALAGVGTVTVMTRALGADGYGIYRTAFTFVSFAAVSANLGLSYVALREAAVDGGRGDRIVGAALTLRLLATLLALAAGLVIALFLPWDRIVVGVIAIAALGFVAFNGNEILTAILQWRLRQDRAVLAETIGVTLALLAVVVAARFHLGVLGMMSSTSFGLIVTFLIAWRYASRLGPLHLVADKEIWGALARPGLPVAVSIYLALISLRGDTLLLSFLKPPEDVGYYGIVSKIYELGLQLPVLFGGLLMPRLSRSAGNAQEMRRQISDALHVLVIVGVAIALTLAFFSGEIVTILAGRGFMPASPALAVTGFSLALASCSAVLRYAIVAQGRQMRLMFVEGVATTLSMVAYAALIPHWSFMGAAYGKLGGQIVLLVCLLIVTSRHTGWPVPAQASRVLLTGAVTGGALFAMQQSSLPVLVVALLGALVYGLGLVVTGAVSPAAVRAMLAGEGGR